MSELPAPRRRWPLRWVLLAALGVWLAWALPLALGERTLYLRDVFATHLPFKAFGAEALRSGDVPAFNPQWGLGQVFRGNPNALAFYPGNLLYLVLPFWSAFNLHYMLHWLLATVGMAWLARRLGQSREAAWMAGLTYGGCGWMVSALSFYNILTVAAWWPLVMVGAIRSGRGGVALGGLACGLALLGGEPVTALVAMVPVVWLGLLRFGPRAGLLRAAAIGALGLVVAAPQLVATLRVIGFTVRGTGLGSGAGLYALHPARLLELLVPFPFGRPADFGPTGYWASEWLGRLPYVLSLSIGAVGLVLAVAGARRYRSAAVVAVGGLAAAWLGGLGGDLAARASGGLARYPEKFLVWTALTAPLLAGWGLDALMAKPGRWPRRLLLAAGGAAAAAVALFLSGGPVVRWIESHLRPGSLQGTAPTQVALLLVALLVLAALWTGTAWAVHRGSAVVLLALQLAGLLQLAPAVPTETLEPYGRPPAWAERVSPGAGVVCGTVGSPFQDPEPRYRTPDTRFGARLRLAAADLEPAPGLLHGLSYPAAPDLEGMHTPPFGWMLYRLPRLEPAGRSAWLRALGVEAITVARDPRRPEAAELPGTVLLAEAERAGVETRLLQIEGAAPRAWWPGSLRPAASREEAFWTVSRLPDATTTAVLAGGAPVPLGTQPAGRVRPLVWEADRMVIETEVSPRPSSADVGGIVVLRRAYHPLLRATIDGEPAATLPVNLGLLGVVAPPGRSRIEIHAGAGPERWAGAIAILAALGLAWIAWRER